MALDRPTFRRLKKAIESQLEEQKDQSFVAITSGFLAYNFSSIEIEKGFVAACESLGLVDDGTRTRTFTLPGKSVMDHYQADSMNDLKTKVVERFEDKYPEFNK